MAGIVEHPTKADLVRVCNKVLELVKQGKTPVINGVMFEAWKKLGRCQQHVREAVEATVYGAEGLWPYASCCAGSTAKRLLAGGFLKSKSLDGVEPGDLVYMTGGKTCSTCRGQVGHTGIWIGDGLLWQNTSAGNRGTCAIGISDSQKQRLIGVFEILPEAVQEPYRIVDLATNKIVGWASDEGMSHLDRRRVYAHFE